MSPLKTQDEKRREYEELTAFFDRFLFHYYSIHGMKSSAEGSRDPRFESDEWKKAEIEYYGLPSLLSGAKEAANDMIQMSVDMTADQVRRIDAALRVDGVLTLSEVRVRYSGRYKSILKRGRIRSDMEFRMVAGILADVESTIPTEERARLERLSFEYEQKA
ncbi:MAG: hypothetical protein QNI94_12245 [Kiloniellales bacterium]|nr:hypothetical protein [Kiloniellales bacterium]